jgi:hypothetical protein
MGSTNSRERSAVFKEKYTELKGKIKYNETFEGKESDVSCEL